MTKLLIKQKTMKRESNNISECTELHNMRESVNFNAATWEWLIHKSRTVKESTLAQYHSIIRVVLKDF